jgi:hypothetical protein
VPKDVSLFNEYSSFAESSCTILSILSKNSLDVVLSA